MTRCGYADKKSSGSKNREGLEGCVLTMLEKVSSWENTRVGGLGIGRLGRLVKREDGKWKSGLEDMWQRGHGERVLGGSGNRKVEDWARRNNQRNGE